MERVSVLCLLLLFCSLMGADPQDNEFTEQREASPESLNVAEPQSDLLAVLRDMSTKLAELQVKIEMLNQRQVKMETLNREQAAKLTELERQTSQVDEQQQARRVAFSASLIASGGGFTGPFSTPVPLVFRNVVTNIGNAYSPNTGFFTAQVRGAYHFEFHIYNIMDGYLGSGAYLVRNGLNVCIAYEFQSNGASTSSNSVTLFLRAGDVVSLHQWANTKIYDDQKRFSTFSGHLLFPL